MVPLKNEKHILPLKKEINVAVIGTLAKHNLLMNSAQND